MRASVAVAVVCLSLVSITSANEAVAAIRRPTSIAPQGLAPALKMLAEERDVQLVYRSDLVEDRRTGGAAGDMTFDEALTQLLKGTGLTYEYLDSNAITIIPIKTSRNGAASPSGSSGGRVSFSSLFAAAESSPAGEGRGAGRGGENDASSQINPSTDPTSDSSVRLEQVVVTATRREERLSKVPLSVSTYSQDVLDKKSIKSIEGIAQFTPGVTYRLDSVGLFYEIAIRGISSQVGAATTGIYVDDTPIQARAGVSENSYPILFDQERVEVLRGPQGTLFGSGAEGGAVRFITPEPGLSNYSGYTRAEAGGTQKGAASYEVGAALGGPIAQDRVGFRLSAYFRKDGGYIDSFDYQSGSIVNRDVNHIDTTALRGALKFAVTDTLAITPSILYQDRRAASDNLTWDILSNPDEGDFRTGFIQPQPHSDKFVMPAVKIDWEAEGLRLISNTSFFYDHDDRVNDYTPFINCLLWVATPCTTPPASPTPGYFALSEFVSYTNSLTQEVRLQSTDPAARLVWVAGAFYQRSRISGGQTIEDLFMPQLSQSIYGGSIEEEFGSDLIDGRYAYQLGRHLHDEQYALFGQVDYSLTDKLKATAGLRAAHTKFGFTQSRAGPLTSAKSAAGDQSEHPLTPKFGLSYQVDEGNMVYASAAKGFRIGGANTPIPGTTPGCLQNLNAVGLSSFPGQYDSDSLWSYELGSKDRFAGGRAQVFASVYYIKWKRIQQAVSLPGCGTTFVANLGEATSKGFDVGLQAQLTRSLLVTLDVGYTRAKFDKTLETATTHAVIIEAGDSLGVAPWSSSLSGQYDLHLGNQAGYIRADYTYTSRNTTPTPIVDPRVSPSFGYDPDLRLPPATQQLNLRAGVIVSDVDVSIFSNNVLNQTPELARIHDFPGETFFYTPTFRPRTIGVTASYRF